MDSKLKCNNLNIYIMRQLILYLLVLLLTTPVIAQNSDKIIRLGIGASPSVSWLKSDYNNIENDGIKTGIKYGINVDYKILDNYYFATGIFLSTQSGKLKYLDENIPFMIGGSLELFNEDSGQNVTFNYKLKYIDIPIGLKLKTNEIGYFTYFAKFGLNAMFNLSAIGNANQKSVVDADLNEEINFFNLGYHFGAGMEYALSSNFILTGGISYYNGFFDVTHSTDGREKEKTTLSNISVDLGIFF